MPRAPRLTCTNNHSNSEPFIQRAIIISGFPCIGKSYFKENRPDLKVYYLDSGENDHKDKAGVWMQHYLEKVIEAVTEPHGIVMVSCHKDFRKRMQEAGLRYIRVYPRPELKDEWLNRQECRAGGKDILWNKMNKDWNDWMEIHGGFQGETSPEVILGRDDHLIDRLTEICEAARNL
ncbi:hypothetical protein J7T55_012957 [Diaporthe amygdali]|uniref:uncharacterized protein n=1 Tax=Phomopsis amygdali TaxID=1214568 RepID=UPI0022FE3B63|nr:uncharacterized protein J7T55_012957 [Diaporthe amygdali]KAJ0118703.1 hypothetical protein J7T55_012957 [Diaporthe amygdali]